MRIKIDMNGNSPAYIQMSAQIAAAIRRENTGRAINCRRKQNSAMRRDWPKARSERHSTSWKKKAISEECTEAALMFRAGSRNCAGWCSLIIAAKKKE